MIVKLSPNVGDIARIALAAEKVERMLHSSEYFFRMAIDIKAKQPVLETLKVDFQSPAINPLPYGWWEVYEKVSIPIIGMENCRTP